MTVEMELAISNERGLHARAAAKFVKVVEQYDACVSVMKDGEEVAGNSIMGLMMLAAAAGTAIRVRAVGTDAAQAVQALAELVGNKFDEC